MGQPDKPIREVSVEGCEVLGRGGNGAVYKLDDETIVKEYFKERSSLEKINQSRENTRAAFVAGVPTMIAFDLVRVGDNYGVIYEMINADSMNRIIPQNPEKIEEYADLITDTLIKLHHTKLKKGVLPDARGKYWTEIRQTKEAGFYTEEEAAKVKALIDAIPERNTFIHMDYHPGNMMLQNGELMLIDVDDSGLGHPIIDLAAMYLVYVTAAKSNWKVTSQDIKKKHYDILWDRFVKRYFNTNDPKEIAEINRLIYGYSLPRFIRGVACSPSVPNILRKPIVSSAKKKRFSMIDTLHPIP